MAEDKSILAVTAARDVSAAIQNSLLEEGIKVQSACCLQEVLSHCGQKPPVIFLDTEVNVHWRATLQELLHRWPYSSVVIVSRLADERMWIDALEAGASDLLIRPFRPEEIRWVVRCALGRQNKPPHLPSHSPPEPERGLSPATNY